ncbi:6,7-dimethyl-8-ribityllumazine synthase [uncultured Paludibacter sp.]|nr:6,7-dimethyl-8-ribityllumazine synthase [uncultured Paludibacter sp.]
MATELYNLSDYDPDAMPDKEVVAKQRYGIVVAEWNPSITEILKEGAYKALLECGAIKQNIDVIHVPGTIELTYGAKYLLEQKKKYNAIIVLGCVIQGETRHFDFVCESVTHGITELNLRSDACPVIFGVLTTNNLQQAKDRAGGIHGNKGEEAAITAVKMANIVL